MTEIVRSLLGLDYVGGGGMQRNRSNVMSAGFRTYWADKARFGHGTERGGFPSRPGRKNVTNTKSKRPKNPIGKARMLTSDEFDLAIKKAEDRPYWMRDRLLVMFSRYCGLRAKEIAHIHFADITDARGKLIDRLEVTARGAKYGKPRTLKMRVELVDALDEYLRQSEITAGPIFWTQRGTPMTSNAVQKQIAAVYQSCGFVGARSHSGRRYAITTMAQNANSVGASLEDVRIFAGHSRLDTTSTYIEQSPYADKLIALL